MFRGVRPLAHLGFQLDVVMLDLVGQRLDPECRLDARYQFLVADRLNDEVVCPQLQCLEPALHLILGGGQKQDRNASGTGIGTQPTTDFESIHARHLHVQQHQIVVGLGDTGQGRLPIAALIHRVIGQLADRFSDSESAVVVVIDQQYSSHEANAPSALAGGLALPRAHPLADDSGAAKPRLPVLGSPPRSPENLLHSSTF